MADSNDIPADQPEAQNVDAENAAESSLEAAQRSADELEAGVQDPQTPVSADAEARTAEALKAAQETLAAAKAGSQASDPIAQIASEAVREHVESSSRPFTPPAINGDGRAHASREVDLLADVNLHVKIELGRTRMYVEDVLKLGEGAVVELDKAAGDPVDIYVNDRHVARGEVLVINDCFCVRVSEIVASAATE